MQIGRGDRQIPKILETLARLRMTRSADLGDILRRGLKLPWGTSGVSLTYDSAESLQQVLAYFNHRRGPVLSVVCRAEPAPVGDRKLEAAKVMTLEDICRN